MNPKEIYSKKLERIGIDLFGKKFKAPLAKKLNIDRTQLWKHLGGEYDDNPSVYKAYEIILDNLERENKAKTEQPAKSPKMESLDLAVRILQSQMKTVYEHVGLEYKIPEP